MRKRSMTALVASLLLLTACTAPAEKAEGQVPAADAEATDFQERADPAPESPNLLPDLDVSGLEETMPETDFAAFRAYLPVLTGEESFRWVAGPYDGYPDGDWEPFDAFMAAVHDRYWSRGGEPGGDTDAGSAGGGGHRRRRGAGAGAAAPGQGL